MDKDVELSEQDFSKKPISSKTKAKREDIDPESEYGLLPKLYTNKKVTGKQALHDMFLKDAVPAEKTDRYKSGTKVGLGGKRITEAEWVQKLVSMQNSIGDDNIKRLKD